MQVHCVSETRSQWSVMRCIAYLSLRDVEAVALIAVLIPLVDLDIAVSVGSHVDVDVEVGRMFIPWLCEAQLRSAMSTAVEVDSI